MEKFFKGHPPVVVVALSLWSEAAPAGNRNSNPRTGNSRRNMDRCSRLYNHRNRNSRNRNL